MVTRASRGISCVLLFLGFFTGCTSSRPAETCAAKLQLQPRIELLGFPDCPDTPAMRIRLKAAIAMLGKGWTFIDTNQEDLPEGDVRRGYATPTILVDGRDLFGLPVPTVTNPGCRIYGGGLPEEGMIARRMSDSGFR